MYNPKGYQNLIAWQLGIKLVSQIYEITKKFPSEERFGLISQLRRASVSIPSNISEGYRRITKNDFVYFLRIAHGSVAEVETQLIISVQLGYFSQEEHKEISVLIDELSKVLWGLIRARMVT